LESLDNRNREGGGVSKEDMRMEGRRRELY
jgi:hypothetical protein